MKRLAIIFSLLAATLCAAASDISDLALIYQGADHRIKWTADQIAPYVTHKYADGTEDWLFDGFLFLELNNGTGKCFTTMEIRDGYTPADRTVWQTQLDRLFTADQALDALDKAIGQAKQRLGDPGFRHKVVIMVPAPISGYQDWGKIGLRKLNFNKESDRVRAMKWYINEICKRFKKAGYANLELDGIYWIDEMQRDASDIPAKIAPYVHKKKLNFYWIPFYGAEGLERWQDLGFDRAYLQPNYFFHPTIGSERLDKAISTAKSNGMGLELELDERILSDAGTYLPRLNDYLDHFERGGVFAGLPVAYYMGSNAIWGASRKPEASCRSSIDRMARLIARRHSPAKAATTTAPTTDYDSLRRNATEVKF